MIESNTNDQSAAKASVFTPEGELPFQIALPVFEGPLDLLLHLIEKHELDLFDIPIAVVTARYLEYLELMRSMNLDIAGEFLLMAASLAHLKSKLLLPREAVTDAPGEEGPDPREELVRRLLMYQKYRDAGVQLGALPQLGRDVFVRGGKEAPPENDAIVVAETSVFKLVEAFDRMLKASHIELPHEVFVDRINITDRIHEIVDRLRAGPRLRFSALFHFSEGKQAVVATFLALLEMCRLKLVRVHQPDERGEIYVSGTDNLNAPAALESGLDYRN